MQTTIAKEFTFDAAHRLDFLPTDHKCHRMHGHTYRVEIQLRGQPDENDFLVDYDLIAIAWARIHAMVDHRVLNDVHGLERPTTEALCRWIWMEIAARSDDACLPVAALLYKVRVSESSTTWAEVGRE